MSVATMTAPERGNIKPVTRTEEPGSATKVVVEQIETIKDEAARGRFGPERDRFHAEGGGEGKESHDKGDCLPDECQSWQVKTMLRQVIRLPALLVRHARVLMARVEVPPQWLVWWQNWLRRWWESGAATAAG